jgi:hypothetical protein
MSTVSMLYGGALSVVVALVLLTVAGKDRRAPVLVVAGLAALVMRVFGSERG